MVRDVLRLLVDSAWLWWLTAAAGWAVIGALVASRVGLPVAAGAAVGAALPAVGALVLLAWAYARGEPAPAANPWAAPTAPAATGNPWVSPVEPWLPAQSGLPAQPGLPAPVRPARVPLSPTGQVLSILVPALIAVLLGGALVEPWFEVQPLGAWLPGYAGTSSPLSAVPLVLSLLVLVTAGLLYGVRPRRAWVAAVVLSSTPWLGLGGQLLIATADVTRIVDDLSHGAAGHAGVEVSAGPGSYLMFAAGLGGLAWAAVAAVDAHRRGAVGGLPARLGFVTGKGTR